MPGDSAGNILIFRNTRGFAVPQKGYGLISLPGRNRYDQRTSRNSNRWGLDQNAIHFNLNVKPPLRGDLRKGLMKGVVMGNSLLAIEPGSKDAVSDDAIRDQLTRLLESSIFVQSERLGQFLRFTVETTLEGNAETLKEYVIGTEVYGRGPSYHPIEDSIVRSEARRLRRKLQEFYETVGKDDPILIRYRPGSYVPAFKMRGPSGAPRIVDAPTLRPELRVAVLPFADLSKGALSGAYAQFLTDDLIHQLVRTDGVRVVTGYSAEGVGIVDIPSLAKTLDVRIVFEGTVAEDNSQLRVTSRVVNSDGLRICSERFETNRDSQGLLSISARIASALISRVCPEQPLMEKINHSATHSLALRAEGLLDEGTLAGTQAALAKWREVIEIEPRYVRAICGVAQSYCEMALRGIPDSFAAVTHAHQAAERAVELDPDMMLVPACLASALALSWKWREAEVSFKQALGLGDHAGTYRQYAMFLAARSRLREAWNYIQKAQQIDPFSYRQKVLYTRLLYVSRNYEDGMRYMSEQLLYGRLPNEAELYRAMMLISNNRRDEARRMAQELLDKSDSQPVMMSGVAEVLAACGETDAAGRIAADSDLFAPHSPISKFRQTLLMLAFGNRDRAISLLSAAYEEREAELIWLGCDPRLDPIRHDSRFTVLLNGVMLDSPARTLAMASGL
jgi:TolB-like protein/tetratricopeptide (TPR) repeat protein